MAIDTTVRRNDYLGTDSTDTFDYEFKIFAKEDLQVFEIDDEGNVDELELDVDYEVTGIGLNAGGQITLLSGNLEEDFQLVILGNRDPLQQAKPTNQGNYLPQMHENAFDNFVMFIQQLFEFMTRAVQLPKWIKSSDFDTTLPDNIIDGGENKVLGIKEDGTGFAVVTAGSGGGGGSLPDEPGEDYALLQANAASDTGTEWTDPVEYIGYSDRFSDLVELSGAKATLDYIMNMGYVAPTVSLSTNPNYATLRERGATISSVDLSALIIKTLNDVQEVRFYRGATLLDTQTSGGGIPTGGTSTYTDANSFSTDRTYSVQVDDDSVQAKPSATSTRTFTFVYPYYYGVGAAGLGTGVTALTKQVISESTSAVRSFTVNGTQKMYFAYPAAYGNLLHIYDINNFDTVGDWTKTTANITGLDGNAVSYNIYEFNNFAVAGTYQYTFNQ